MSKFLVTGGAGFIGSHFLRYSLENYKEDSFVCLDSLTYAGNLGNIEDLLNYKNFKFVKEDILNKESIFKIFEEEKFDFVVNFAAETHVDRSVIEPEIFIKTNVLGTQILLDASLKYKVKRFHQVSTDEVYGDLPLDSKDKFNEKSNLNPSSPYSASKASADLLCMSYIRTYKMPITISRSSNNYGPYQYPEKLIPLVISKILKNEKIPVYGFGLNKRNWIYVLDNVKAIDLILRKGNDGEIYNVSSDFEISNIELVKTILKNLNCDTSQIEYVADRPGHDLRYMMSNEKLKALGFEEEVSFEKGLKETIDWYLCNQKNLDSNE